MGVSLKKRNKIVLISLAIIACGTTLFFDFVSFAGSAWFSDVSKDYRSKAHWEFWASVYAVLFFVLLLIFGWLIFVLVRKIKER